MAQRNSVESVENLSKTLWPTTRVFRVLEKRPLPEQNDRVRFLGHSYLRPDEEADRPAVAALLAKLDRALLVGGSDPREITGLVRLAPLRATPSADSFDAWCAEVPGTLVFDLNEPEWCDEGDLPRPAGLVAVRPGAVVWWQLLPMTRVDLRAQRSIPRALVAIYGYLDLVEPEGTLILLRPRSER